MYNFCKIGIMSAKTGMMSVNQYNVCKTGTCIMSAKTGIMNAKTDTYIMSVLLSKMSAKQVYCL